MAIRALQGGVLNQIQFVPANGGLPIAYKQWQMGKEWFKQAQLSWQKKAYYSQKIQLSDTVNIQYNRTEDNDINLYIVDCNGEELHNLTSIAQVFSVPGNTFQDEQLVTHHFTFKPSTYLGTSEGIYYLRMDAIYYDGVDEVDRLTMFSEPISIKASHPLTTLIQYRLNTNDDDVIFVHPQLTAFSFGLRIDGWIENYQPDSADVYFKEQDYDQRVISSEPWRKFTLQAGGLKGVPPYEIEKLNAALSCGRAKGVLLLNGVRHTKDEGAKLETEQLGVAYPLYIARVDVREYDPTQAITFSRNSSFLMVNEYPYPYNIQRVDFANPTIIRVVTSIEGTTEIYDSADLDAFVTWFNNTRAGQLYLTGEAVRIGNEVWYVNGDGEQYTSTFRIQDPYLMNFEVNANGAPKTFYLSLAEGYGTIFWGNGAVNLHEPTSTALNTVTVTYSVDNTYTVKLWHNGIIRTISHDSRSSVNGVVTYNARITDITGQAPWRLKKLILGGEDFSGLASGLNLSFLSASGNEMAELSILTITQSNLVGFNGTVFASNPYAPTTPWWRDLVIINVFGNAFTVSEIDSLVNDFYDNAPHWTPGTLDLRQVPAAIATGTAAAKLVLLDNAGWNILP